jgi:hypothetical protein
VLQTVVDEFANLSSETTSVFIFNENGETIASDRVTTEDQTKSVVTSFTNLSLQSDIIGGLENLSIQGATSQIQIAAIENLYLAMVSSREADVKIIDSLTHVLVPTIVKLLNQQLTKEDQLAEESLEIPKEPEIELKEEEAPVDEIPQELEIEATEEEEPVDDAVLPEEESTMDDSSSEEESSSEPLLPEPPINQLMVEKIKGFRVPADTVRVDSEVIAKWTELYDEKELLISIQTLEGKETTCKFRPLKDSRSNAKGIIQIPERILQILEVTKGQLVMVSPEIDTSGER